MTVEVLYTLCRQAGFTNNASGLLQSASGMLHNGSDVGKSKHPSVTSYYIHLMEEWIRIYIYMCVLVCILCINKPNISVHR